MYLRAQKIVRHSEKNGEIVAYKRGAWRVTVDGCQQTGPELHRMWKGALAALLIYLGIQRVKKILLLGLGAGGELKSYYQRFKGADITVVEYDEEMIALAKELQLYAPYTLPHVICEDVRTALPALQGKFDLIVADLFHGETPSPLLEDPAFLAELDTKLAPDGYLLVNAYKHAGMFPVLEKVFSPLKKWMFDESHLGIFQGSALKKSFSDGYRPVREWKEYDGLKSIPSFFSPAKVGVHEEGSYWRFGPVSFEHYKSETEPNIAPLPRRLKAPLRVIMWQRLTRSDATPPWIAFSDRPAWKIGFVPLVEDYTKHWSESARRGLKAWKSSVSEKYTLEEIHWEEFERALKASTLPHTMRGAACFEIKMRMKNPQTKVVLVGVRRRSNKRIVAGMARMYATHAPFSYYMNGFYRKEVAHEPVMVGLFANFFDEAIARGARYLDFGNFWKAGDDSGWKGFSLFKGKFNPLYFFFPATLYQFRFFEK